MYAVIATGGKQYRVTPGQKLRVEKLPAGEGEEVVLDKVLMVADGENIRVGSPYLEGSRVTATVEGHGRGDKIRIVKMRRRKHSRKQMGHRQSYTLLAITGIEAAPPAA
jgi:large subunit ribosomal protein L21